MRRLRDPTHRRSRRRPGCRRARRDRGLRCRRPLLLDDGATVSATTTGSADIPALTLTATGLAPPRGRFPDDEITIVDGQDYTITWPPGGGGRILLTLNANNQGHGNPFTSIIRCDVPDADGELTVPGALIAQFDTTYRWEICAGQDCPLSTLARYHEDTATIAGGVVRLRVASEVHFWVIHD